MSLAASGRQFYLFVLLVTALPLFLAGCGALGFQGVTPGAPGLLGQESRPLRQPQIELPAPSFAASPELAGEIRKLTTNEALYIRRSLVRRAPYYRKLRELFEAEGVPPELVHVALVESNFDPRARGTKGARGLWQFMRGTARLYGLRSGLLSDEREDPILSSIAAARYFRDLYLLYRDWYFALAAYNVGTGRIKRSIAARHSFWEAARMGAVPAAGVRFVRRAASVCAVMHEPERFGFKVPARENSAGGL